MFIQPPFTLDSKIQLTIPALTTAEFQALEQDILTRKQVVVPLLLWRGILIDGYARWKVISSHPDVPIRYEVHNMLFDYIKIEDVISWRQHSALGRGCSCSDYIPPEEFHKEKAAEKQNRKS